MGDQVLREVAQIDCPTICGPATWPGAPAATSLCWRFSDLGPQESSVAWRNASAGRVGRHRFQAQRQAEVTAGQGDGKRGLAILTASAGIAHCPADTRDPRCWCNWPTPP